MSSTEKDSARFYRVAIEPAAWKQIMALSAAQQQRVFATIEALEFNPRPSGVMKLHDSSERYRMRNGNYRVLYEIRDEILVVVIVEVGNRRDVYRKR